MVDMYGNDLEIVPGRRFEKIRTGAYILLHETKLYLEGLQYLEGIERTRNVSLAVECFLQVWTGNYDAAMALESIKQEVQEVGLRRMSSQSLCILGQLYCGGVMAVNLRRLPWKCDCEKRKQHIKKGIRCWMQAAEACNADACYLLWKHRRYVESVYGPIPEDCLLRAAEGGNPNAQYEQGVLCLDEGPDLSGALDWFAQALAQGNKDALDRIDILP